MARRGTACVGFDNSQRQLDTARRLAQLHGVELEPSHTEDAPAGRELLHPYFGMHRIDWDDGIDEGT